MCPPRMYSPVLFIYGDIEIIAEENNKALIYLELMFNLILHVDLLLNYILHLCGLVEYVLKYIFSFLKYDCPNVFLFTRCLLTNARLSQVLYRPIYVNLIAMVTKCSNKPDFGGWGRGKVAALAILGHVQNLFARNGKGKIGKYFSSLTVILSSYSWVKLLKNQSCGNK